jgi:hypothetical protein
VQRAAAAVADRRERAIADAAAAAGWRALVRASAAAGSSPIGTRSLGSARDRAPTRHAATPLVLFSRLAQNATKASNWLGLAQDATGAPSGPETLSLTWPGVSGGRGG